MDHVCTATVRPMIAVHLLSPTLPSRVDNPHIDFAYFSSIHVNCFAIRLEVNTNVQWRRWARGPHVPFCLSCHHWPAAGVPPAWVPRADNSAASAWLHHQTRVMAGGAMRGISRAVYGPCSKKRARINRGLFTALPWVIRSSVAALVVYSSLQVRMILWYGNTVATKNSTFYNI